MTDRPTSIGCFKVGDKVHVGSGKTVWTLTSGYVNELNCGFYIQSESCKSSSRYIDIKRISLAGPNGKGA